MANNHIQTLMDSDVQVELNNNAPVPWNIENTIWFPYKNHLDALDVNYPRWVGEKTLTFKVLLEDGIVPKYHHIFFMENKNGEIVVVGNSLTFKTPQGVIDYLKSPKCSREHILRVKNAEQMLNDE